MYNKYLMLIMALILSCSGVACEKESLIPNLKKYNQEDRVGASARDLLSDENYTILNIEIQPIKNMNPDPQTITQLKTFLGALLKKTINVTVNTEINSPGNGAYSPDFIRNFEKNHRTSQTSGDTITIYALFMDGNSSDDNGSGKVLGQAYWNTSIVLFEKTIQSLSGGIGKPTRTKLESAVLNHEFGHLLGLVNVGSNMVSGHQDSANGHHCNNQNCLMYWNVDTSNVVANILNSPIPVLDQDCKNDLQSNGGK